MGCVTHQFPEHCSVSLTGLPLPRATRLIVLCLFHRTVFGKIPLDIYIDKCNNRAIELPKVCADNLLISLENEKCCAEVAYSLGIATCSQVENPVQSWDRELARFMLYLHRQSRPGPARVGNPSLTGALYV